MSASTVPVLAPAPDTTLFVVLGASTYPRKPVWTNHVLGASARALRNYAVSPLGLGVPAPQILDLFDDVAPAAKQCEVVEAFLRDDAFRSARDLIVYYIGHGGFDAEEYYLAVHDTANNREFLTAIESRKLARIILESFGRGRVYVILDSCFAASAASDWQGSELELAVKRMSKPLPKRGTAFLAAASKDNVALAPKSGTYTMFTGALLESLERGIAGGAERLSLYELYESIRDTFNEQSSTDGTRPELHAPRQNEGDISLLPLFPNSSFRRGMIGEVIKDFKIIGRLGKGGMGEVWMAEQQIVKTKVAIKMLVADVSSDHQFVRRFFNEAVAVSEIRHAGIVRIYDVGFHKGSAYLIMELLEGETLGSRIRRAGRLSLAQVGDVGRQIASVLEATHAAHITHRDLKPDNIFLVRDAELTSGERVKILDFGIAKLGTSTGLTAAGGMMGTPGYMAPEQWADAAKVDARADVYAVGCIVFEMCCGRPPFIVSSLPEAYAKHVNEIPPRARVLVREIPRELDDMIAAALAKQPAERPSMMEFQQVFAALARAHPAALALALTQPPTGDIVAIHAQRPPGELARPRWPLALAVLAIAGTAVGIVAYRVHEPTMPPPARCGNGVVDPGEQCDGASIAGSACDEKCMLLYKPPDAVPGTSYVPQGAKPQFGICPDGMVRVPAGTFRMGSPDGIGEKHEHPAHEVTLSPYCIDSTEVTVQAYAACVRAGSCTVLPLTVNWSSVSEEDSALNSQFCNKMDRPDHPLNCVDWNEAMGFCAWAGKRLPTEAEWEFAARGTDGRTYPWGNGRPTEQLMNACGPECVAMAKRVMGRDWGTSEVASDGWETTAPVGSFPKGASPFGALDMAGNVWEWTADWYGPYRDEAVTNPRGSKTGSTRVIRGGSWNVGSAGRGRAAMRDDVEASYREHNVGFRCARGD